MALGADPSGCLARDRVPAGRLEGSDEEPAAVKASLGVEGTVVEDVALLEGLGKPKAALGVESTLSTALKAALGVAGGGGDGGCEDHPEFHDQPAFHDHEFHGQVLFHLELPLHEPPLRDTEFTPVELDPDGQSGHVGTALGGAAGDSSGCSGDRVPAGRP